MRFRRVVGLTVFVASFWAFPITFLVAPERLAGLPGAVLVLTVLAYVITCAIVLRSRTIAGALVGVVGVALTPPLPCSYSINDFQGIVLWVGGGGLAGL